MPVNARMFRTAAVRPQGVPTSQPPAAVPSTGTTTPVGVAAAPRYEGASVVTVDGAWTGGAGTAASGTTAAMGRSCASSTGPPWHAVATAAIARRYEARVIRTASLWLAVAKKMVNVSRRGRARPAGRRVLPAQPSTASRRRSADPVCRWRGRRHPESGR